MVVRRSIGFGMIAVGFLFSYNLYHSSLGTVITLQNILVFAFFVLALVFYGFGLFFHITLFRSRLPLRCLITFGCALLIVFALGSGEGFVAIDQAGHIGSGDSELLTIHLALLEMAVLYLFLPVVLWLPMSYIVSMVRSRTKWWFEA